MSALPVTDDWKRETLRGRWEAAVKRIRSQFPDLSAEKRKQVLEYFDWLLRTIAESQALTRDERICLASRSPEDFARIYLPEFLTQATPEFHKDIYNLMSGGWRKELPTGAGAAIAAPRGHAKSTIVSFIIPLWWIYTKRKRFVVILSNTDPQAAYFADSIRREIEENQLLRADFGDITGDRRGLRRPLKWTQKDFITLHQDGFTTRTVARGKGASLRGLRTRAWRPDVIILDDVEDDESVNTSEQRKKTWDWLTKQIFPMLDPITGEVYAIGTILHYNSALQRMLGQKDVYATRLYRAIKRTEDGYPPNEAGQPLWPERFNLTKLDLEKRRMGSLAFNQEYMNIPISEEDRPFPPKWFCWYPRRELRFDREERKWYWRDFELTIYGGVDLAIGEEEVHNKFAYLVIGVTEEHDVIIVWCWQKRINFPDQVTELVHLIKSYPFKRLAVESVAYQRALAQQLLIKEERAGRVLKQITTQTKEKWTRIYAMSPLFENLKVYFPLAEEGQPGELDDLAENRMPIWVVALYQQLVQAPRSEDTDLVDALEMATRIGVKVKQGFVDFF